MTQAVALVCAMAVVGAGCGDDDDATSGTAAPTTAGTSTPATTTGATTSATSASASTTAPGASADNPAGVGTSQLLAGGPYGQDASNKDVYKGAGGFELDVSKCPADYDVNQGITATEIHLAHSLPKSGPLAGFGIITDGMSSYYNYVNEKFGGIDGRKITLDFKDDAYEPARTKSNIDEMVESGKYAAFTEILGTANNLAVWDELNLECFPQLVNGSGGAQWGDVENHPWTTGMQLDYFSEAGLWAEWLKKEYPGGVNVAAIVFNNDYGQSYAKGFKSAIKGTNIKLVKEELHEASVPNLTNQFTSLASSNADVLLIETSGAFCTLSMGDVEMGSWKPKVMMSGTCASLNQYFQPLVNQGLTGRDTYLIQTFKDVNDPALANDPYIKLYHDTLTTQGLDSRQTTYFTGWIYAWYAVEVMKLATKLEGGLNRPNLVVANRSMEARYPGLIEGLTNRMEGLKDSYMNEGGRVVQYKVTDPKQLGTFQPAGDVINNEGKTGTYATVKAAG